MIFTISDLHLSLSADKPMDVFGPKWRGYIDRINENWNNVVSTSDTVIIPGDISWAMKLEDALKDFQFIDMLNGKKIILKGNHDYFWQTKAKLDQFFVEENIKSITILHNTAIEVEDKVICGTKGWYPDDHESAATNAKLLNRETMRLEQSLAMGEKCGKEKVVFLHYPPITLQKAVEPIIDVLEKYGVKKCFYGHIHSSGAHNAFQGLYRNIEFKIVSADVLDFCPIKI